ncbi:cytochrome d ubiquinol oxidase subunit II [Desertihabitans brevis]|uniref:Cytochrome d ubiquinol oxidase subunit II n=1 Tax=Desertihabitans brevis TaxID=2268447 RepID=A0A367YXC0_9ACTN|nr:cytochrome d ubiquinol oxidase subunit II [Desertihabitans brevis]RCK70478.1 cytochrome d ubiquinol oxidase subunit II [Desertihabitans brevis]
MDLRVLWFGLVAVLWTGYLVLEGFDFGVGMLLPAARDRAERRVMINTVGPVFDANEVWLITAVGATFAAFPDWYATLFSGFYLPMLLVLLALIVRNVGFEFRHKRDDLTWQRRWEWAIVLGSAVPAALWGLVLSSLVGGVPVNAEGEVVGSVLTPYGLLGALLTTSLFLTHGALFVGLKTVGDIRVRARRWALASGLLTVAVAAVFLAWTVLGQATSPWPAVPALLVLVGLVGGLVAARDGREGWAFAGTALATAALVATLFVTLFPRVMVSSLDPAWSLTVSGSSSTDYTLGIMTVAAIVVTPVVIGYQCWTYWVFRKRLGTHHMPDAQLVAAGRR